MTKVEPVLGKDDLSADRLEGANINPLTGLATDYLNHFNEVVMLLDLLPDMPECAADVMEWTPMSYEQHFQSSSFSEKQLAIRAYQAVPSHLRSALETVVEKINSAVRNAQDVLRGETEISAETAAVVSDSSNQLIKPLISRAGGIIHGRWLETPLSEAEGQAAIDALFD